MWSINIDPIALKFLDNLNGSIQPKALNCLKLLKEHGPFLRQPHSKKIVGYKNLFELRTSGNSPVRLFYTHIQDKFYILHGFIKKSDKTPIREIDSAIRRQRLLTNT
jgi:phage-related protein